MVFRTLSRMTGPGPHVEDLAQEAFLRLYRALPEFRPLRVERGDILPVLLESIAIDASECRCRSIRAAQLTQAVDVQQHAPVAEPTEFVHLHEPRFDVGPLRFHLRRERRRSGFGVGELRLYLRGLVIDFREVLGLDLAVELQFAKFDEKRPLLRRQRVGLTLEHGQTFRRAPRQIVLRLCLRDGRRDSSAAHHRNNCDDRRAPPHGMSRL